MILNGEIVERDFSEYFATCIGDKVLAEALEEFNGQEVNVAWAISLEPITPQRLLEIAISNATGEVDAEFLVCYSETTGYMCLGESSKVGGHDLLEIFQSYQQCYWHEEKRPKYFGVLIVQTEPIDLTELSELENFPR